MEMLANIIGILDSFWEPVKVVAIFLGYLLVGIGLFCFAMSQDRSSGQSMYSSIMMMIAGFFLVSLDAFLDVAGKSLLDENSDLSTLGYSSDSASGGPDLVLVFVFAVVKFLGLIAGIKGIWTLYSQTEQRNSSMFTAVMYLLLAVIGLNMPHFLDMLGTSLGGVAETTIDKVLDL